MFTEWGGGSGSLNEQDQKLMQKIFEQTIRPRFITTVCPVWSGNSSILATFVGSYQIFDGKPTQEIVFVGYYSPGGYQFWLKLTKNSWEIKRGTSF